MQVVTEIATFFKAIDGTKFFSESECDKYEKEHSEETLKAIRKELANISNRLSYYKEWVLPQAEKHLEESKANFVEKRDKGDWAKVSNAYLDFQAKSLKKDQEVKTYKRLRALANSLIQRKNELQSIEAIENKKLYNFDDVFEPRLSLGISSIEITNFKSWAGDKATTIANKKYWGNLYAQYLNRKQEK